jgi:hypothetical protein
MAAPRFGLRSRGVSEVATVLAVGVGFAGLFRAGRALAELISILECSGAIGGTRTLA